MKKARFTALLLVSLVIAVYGLAVPCTLDPASAASKAHLNKTKVTLQSGGTVTLLVKNAKKTVKWTSGNKNMVTVKKVKGKKHQKAVLKAGKKTGSCWVRAKIGNKVLKCRVTVTAGQSVLPPSPEPKPVETLPLEEATDLTSAMNVYTPGDTASDAAFNLAFTKTAFQLLQQVDTGASANVLLSPDSIMTALTMTENGAAGNTLAQMEQKLNNGQTVGAYNEYLSRLHTRLSGDQNLIYTTANSIWMKRGCMTPSGQFLETNKGYHNASYYEAAFDGRTVTDMNNWVYNNSRNMIDKIIDNLGADARFVLLNVVAFEGDWEEPFTQPDASDTMTFNTASGQKQTVARLSGAINRSQDYLEVNGAQGFVKTYKGRSIAFAALLPPENMSVDSYVKSLSGADFAAGWANRKDALIQLTMPEFTYSYGVSLKQALQAMGVTDAFSDAADFSAMTENPVSLCIDDVLHKTFIELNYKGTRAAGATAVIGKENAMPGTSAVRITLDRPFVYALVDTETGLPLFLGILRSAK